MAEGTQDPDPPLSAGLSGMAPSCMAAARPRGHSDAGQLLTVFALRPVEALEAGAGEVADGLDALSLFAAGRVLARGCTGTEGQSVRREAGSLFRATGSAPLGGTETAG